MAKSGGKLVSFFKVVKNRVVVHTDDDLDIVGPMTAVFSAGSTDAAADCIARLQRRVIRAERELMRLALRVQKRQPVGESKHVGFMDAVDGALKLIGSARREKARDAAVRTCQQLRADIVKAGGITNATVVEHGVWMRLSGRERYELPTDKPRRRKARKGGAS